jgi:hypothetical protein
MMAFLKKPLEEQLYKKKPKEESRKKITIQLKSNGCNVKQGQKSGKINPKKHNSPCFSYL